MIYFERGLVRISKHFEQDPREMTITNEVTNEVVNLRVRDISTNPHFYEFDFSDVDLANGTYRYEMGKEVGMIQVGEYLAVVTEYTNERTNVVYER